MASTNTSSEMTHETKLDPIAILTNDHNQVKELFKKFARLHEAEDDKAAGQIAEQICNELTVHTTIEEEIFYPAVRRAIDDNDLMNEAEIEHASTNDLVEQIESMQSSDERYAAAVTVLGEYVNHHIREEQEEMFPLAKQANLDSESLSQEMLARKQELKVELGMEEGEDEEEDEAEEEGSQR